MKFKILYRVGKDLREKIINSNNLDDAEQIATKKYKKWIDVFYVDYSNAKE